MPNMRSQLMFSRKTLLFFGLLWLGMHSVSMAAYVLNVGNFSLPQNTTSNIIALKLSSGTGTAGTNANITGFQVNAVIGDGTGAGSEPFFHAPGPQTGADFSLPLWNAFPSTVGGVSPAASNAKSDAAINVAFTGTGNAVNPGPGESIVNLIVDTTGIAPGVYPLLLTASEAGNSYFAGFGGSQVPITITNGTITVVAPVPEPSTLVLAGIALFGSAGYWAKRRRQPIAA